MIEKLTDIKGIGEKRAENFRKLGINTPDDLLRYLPRRYMDFSALTKLRDARAGECAAFCAEITTRPTLVRAKGYQIVTCRVEDGTGKAQISWFNQPYILSAYHDGDVIYFFGTPDIKGKTLRFSSPKVYKQNPVIVPIYPAKAGIKQSMIVNAVKAVLTDAGGEIEETLPERILKKYDLMPLAEAILSVHFPQSTSDLVKAKTRLAFEDMLLFRVALNLMRLRRKKRSGIAYDTRGVLAEYMTRLPFELTPGQTDVIAQIEKDMQSPHAMNRLVQGDVGSGKTAVAMYAMSIAAKNGYQSVLLAPTEILAAQHYATLTRTFGDGRVALLTGGMTAKQKRTIYADVEAGKYEFITGTHALLQAGLNFSRLGLIICDEQQRFGVEQRAVLMKKAVTADVLVMTATPIPRTLAMVIYGDMDVSQIKGMPKGRQRVKTRIVPEDKRDDMYKYLEREAKEGRQAYVVCPQIENEEGEETSENVKDVYSELCAELSVPVGLLHGKMKAKEKEAAVEKFRSGETKILVSTTVIEVGVDVPSAVNMVIENASCFGLSQLHQLRGRIGRGSEAGYCFLVSDNRDNDRLNALVSTNDGFVIAEKDLSLRGPGQFLGTVQHGESELAMLSLACDMETLTNAKEAADELFIRADDYTEQIVKRAVARFGVGED